MFTTEISDLNPFKLSDFYSPA